MLINQKQYLQGHLDRLLAKNGPSPWTEILKKQIEGFDEPDDYEDAYVVSVGDGKAGAEND